MFLCFYFLFFIIIIYLLVYFHIFNFFSCFIIFILSSLYLYSFRSNSLRSLRERHDSSIVRAQLQRCAMGPPQHLCQNWSARYLCP